MRAGRRRWAKNTQAASGVLDWADGCQYQGEFKGTERHGRGRVRFDTDPSQKKADEVVQVRVTASSWLGLQFCLTQIHPFQIGRTKAKGGCRGRTGWATARGYPRFSTMGGYVHLFCPSSNERRYGRIPSVGLCRLSAPVLCNGAP